MFLLQPSENPRVVYPPARYQADIEVREGNEDQAHPSDLHMPRVQLGHEPPELEADRVAGEMLEPATDYVAARMARKRIEPQQGCIYDQHPPAVREMEGLDGVPSEDAVQDEPEVEEVAVDVLEDER